MISDQFHLPALTLHRHTVISDITAHRLVKRPVLMVKRMRRLMMVSERLKPVRERWSRKMRTNAMPMSEAALSTFTTREMFTIFITSVNVVNVALHYSKGDWSEAKVHEDQEKKRRNVSGSLFAG